MNTTYEETLETLRKLKPVSAREPDIDSAKDLMKLLREELKSEKDAAGFEISVGNAGAVRISGSMLALLERAAELLAEGTSVSVVPVEEELTTQQAADLLNVSRQYVVKLLDNEELPCSMVGTHRRVRLKDVLAYKQLRDRKRREQLKELTQLSEELGGYTELTSADMLEDG
jgi:excisionase family DNA binding protein